MSLAITSTLSQAVVEALRTLGVNTAPGAVNLERPAQRGHGDWSTNAALVNAKFAGRKPRELAASMVDWLNVNPPAHVTKVEVAGPGFVNFHLADSWLHEVLQLVVEEGTDGYAQEPPGTKPSINLEYVSANPTGPLHAGHARWAAYGDALARILSRAGHAVHREFYVNDRGVQMQLFGASLAARRDRTAVPDNGYVGQYIRDWAVDMPDGVDPVLWGEAKAHTYQRDTLARMNVIFDTWSSEKAIAASGAVEATIEELKQAGHTYESEGALWLRTTDYGDDKDRVLIKGDGDYTYFTPDIAFHQDKYTRGDLLIVVLGADHDGYVGRMKAAMRCLDRPSDAIEMIIGQNCVLFRNGVEVKLSKRTGDIIELAEIIDEVGADAAKLTFLQQSIGTALKVDLEAVKAKSMDNPVFYVQYAHARVYGILREAAERGMARRPLDTVDLGPLTHDRELDVLRSLAELPDVVSNAANERAPHKVTTWLRELAGAFQGFYHDCPILRTDVAEEVRQARLWLVEAARIGLVIGLCELLGVSAPERM